MELVIFILLAVVAVAAGVGVIAQRSAVRSALFMLVNFCCLAGLYILLNAQFVAVASRDGTLVDATLAAAPLLRIYAVTDSQIRCLGTRHLEVTERHEGLVAAIAFESVVKLAAVLTVGIFATYYLHNGFADLFQKAGSLADRRFSRA